MAKLDLDMPILCPHENHEAIFDELPDGYATERWGGARQEEPYLRCPVCTATFPKWGIEEYLERA